MNIPIPIVLDDDTSTPQLDGLNPYSLSLQPTWQPEREAMESLRHNLFRNGYSTEVAHKDHRLAS